MKALVCFSHLDWKFVYQRPQHLLSRFAKNYTVYYFEEPKFSENNHLETVCEENISIIRTYVRDIHDYSEIEKLVTDYLAENNIRPDILWYYTPMALNYTEGVDSKVIVYDSMDELSAFKFAPPELIDKEQELLKIADVVFTGGNSLYEAKKHRHNNIHSFPSSIDKSHFSKARQKGEDPIDQITIPHPRFGFYGVVDERFNTGLLKNLAEAKPQWSFIIIGPVVKISKEELPKNDNIFYLGPKSYDELPEYIRHWDIAMNMFALNEATRFISPTKTPEYLSAGLPVISTSIKDVVEPYGTMGLVEIADDANSFIAVAERTLKTPSREEWLDRVDDFLADKSWDNTQQKMEQLINEIN